MATSHRDLGVCVSDGGGWSSPGGPGSGEPVPDPATTPAPQPGSYPPAGYGSTQYGAPQYGGTQYGAPGYAPPPYGGSPLPPAYKPGIIPLRPLGVGEILDGAFTSLRQNPAATLGLSAIVAGTSQLAQFLAQLGTDRASASSFIALGLTLLLTTVAGLLLNGALTLVISESVLGRRVSTGMLLQRVRPLVWRLIGLSLLITLIVGALTITIVGIPFAVFFYVALSLATPALVLENQPVTAAMGRSRALVRGAWWRTFGILLLSLVITQVIASVIVVPFALLGFTGGANILGGATGEPSVVELAVLAVAGAIGATIAAPIRAGIVALLYIDRRMRREGLDITLAEAARQTPAP